MAKTPEFWQGFRGLEHFSESFDELFDRLIGFPVDTPAATVRGPALESFIEDEKLVVRVDLPGIDPAKVEVTVAGNQLTVRGRREDRREQRHRDFIQREVSYGSFERSLTLPRGVETEHVGAAYRNGVLELTIPISKEMTPRKVPIEIERKRTPVAPVKPKSRP
ncbi:MAG TPA: Hsp20/alpha crystallin family protein [Candidatus Binataceae bacterium]|nr:Hsp20/alpha crystallin family protein [Candidatus Binataceae bacterium]